MFEIEEDSIIQPPIMYEDNGCINVKFLGALFGIPRSLSDDVDVWIHEFTESTIEILLKENGYVLGTFEKAFGIACCVVIKIKDIKFKLFMDHFLTSLVTFTILVGNHFSMIIDGDSLWDLVMKQRMKVNK